MWPTTRREARREAGRGGLFFEFGQRLRAAGLNEKSPGGVAPCACPPGGDARPTFADAPTAIILSKLKLLNRNPIGIAVRPVTPDNESRARGYPVLSCPVSQIAVPS